MFTSTVTITFKYIYLYGISIEQFSRIICFLSVKSKQKHGIFLMNKLLALNYTSTHILDAHLLLWGDDSLTHTQNCSRLYKFS